MTSETSNTFLDFDYLNDHPAGDEQSVITIHKDVEAPGSNGEQRVSIKLTSKFHAHSIAALQSLANDDALASVIAMIRDKYLQENGARIELLELQDPALMFNFDINLGFTGEELFNVEFELTAASLSLAMAAFLYLGTPQSLSMVAHALCQPDAVSVQL